MVKSKFLNSDRGAGLILLLPSLLILLIFAVIPLFSALFLSFAKWDLIPNSKPSFIGLKNYINLFTDEYFYKCLTNTFLISILAVPISTFFALIVSNFLSQAIRGINLYRLIYFLPGITTITAVTTVWGYILNPGNGLLNNFLKTIGIHNPPTWLASQMWVIPSLVIIGIWLWVGSDSVIYLAGLKAIPKEYYEASFIDGANWWQQFYLITIPLVSPTTFFLIVTGFISSFQMFDLIYVFTGGGPAGRTMVVNMYIYNTAFKYMRMGYACAASYVLFFIILALTVFQLRAQKKWVHYNT